MSEWKGWIPVGERLPEWNVNVLVWIPAVDGNQALMVVAFVFPGSGKWADADTHAFKYVIGKDGAPTHWMPLPAPPTDGRGEES